MGRQRIDLKRYLHLVEQLAGFLHNGQVARTAHDNAYDRIHSIYFLRFCILYHKNHDGGTQETNPETDNYLCQTMLSQNHSTGT